MQNTSKLSAFLASVPSNAAKEKLREGEQVHALPSETIIFPLKADIDENIILLPDTEDVIITLAIQQKRAKDTVLSEDALRHFAFDVPLHTLSPSVTDTLPSVNTVLRHFQNGQTLSLSLALNVIYRATEKMITDANVLRLQSPLTVIGDLHGQFQDLLSIFESRGFPSADNSFLFLGDYVDRGPCSSEILLLLFTLKINHPQNIHFLRGNHECRSLSTFYGFRQECWSKYGGIAYHRFLKSFESMAIAATIETMYGTLLAVHGGLSPHVQTVQEIETNIHRFREPDAKGPLCDLLWSDPARNEGLSEDWMENDVRGCSFTFSQRICEDFLKRNKLLALIRAHELENEGFRERFAKGNSAFPIIVTVFSAPEYCNKHSNVGATLRIPSHARIDGTPSLEYRKHRKSGVKEKLYTGTSAFVSMQKFLQQELSFLSLEFYALVKLCRDIKANDESDDPQKLQFFPEKREVRVMRFSKWNRMYRFVSRVFVDKRKARETNASNSAPSKVSKCDSLSDIHAFQEKEWLALKLYFSFLDLTGHGIIVEESFIALLADVDSEAYATEEEVKVIMDAMDRDQDGIVSDQDFLEFAYLSKCLCA